MSDTTTEALEPAVGIEQVQVDRPGRGVEPDWVAVEEPLEIRLDDEPLVVTNPASGTSRRASILKVGEPDRP